MCTLTPNSSIICWFIFNSPLLGVKMCINLTCLFDSGSSRQILQRSKFSLCKCICVLFMVNGCLRTPAPAQTKRSDDGTRWEAAAVNVVSYERWDQWQADIVIYWFSARFGLVPAVIDVQQFSWPNAQTRRTTEFQRLTLGLGIINYNIILLR